MAARSPWLLHAKRELCRGCRQALSSPPSEEEEAFLVPKAFRAKWAKWRNEGVADATGELRCKHGGWLVDGARCISAAAWSHTEACPAPEEAAARETVSSQRLLEPSPRALFPDSTPSLPMSPHISPQALFPDSTPLPRESTSACAACSAERRSLLEGAKGNAALRAAQRQQLGPFRCREWCDSRQRLETRLPSPPRPAAGRGGAAC